MNDSIKLSKMPFDAAMRLIDEAHAQDPRRTEEGLPFELRYAQRMSHWLARLYPQASEALQLAARAQHIRRWEIGRETFPMDRAGYHRWRATLYGHHADVTEGILRQAGYDGETIERMKSLLKKERLKTNPEMQALEDVACLVFLEAELASFSEKHSDEKMKTILERTWVKMSEVGRKVAVELELPERASKLLEQALSGSSGGNAEAVKK